MLQSNMSGTMNTERAIHGPCEFIRNGPFNLKGGGYGLFWREQILSNNLMEKNMGIKNILKALSRRVF